MDGNDFMALVERLQSQTLDDCVTQAKTILQRSHLLRRPIGTCPCCTLNIVACSVGFQLAYSTKQFCEKIPEEWKSVKDM